MTMFRLATRTPVHEIVRDLAVPHLGADYLPIVGARFVFADHRDVYAPPFDHVPSVSFGIDAFDVPGVDSNDYLGPAAEMLVSLIDRSDIDSGVLLAWQEEMIPFAKWSKNAVTLFHYCTSIRERYGAWGRLDHHVLWQTVPPALISADVAFVVDDDPVSINAIEMKNYDAEDDSSLHELFKRALSKDGTYDGTAWVALESSNQASRLAHFFASVEMDFGGDNRCTWSTAIDRFLPETYRSSAPNPYFANRIVLFSDDQRYVLWERGETRRTVSAEMYERSDKRQYQRWDPAGFLQ